MHTLPDPTSDASTEWHTHLSSVPDIGYKTRSRYFMSLLTVFLLFPTTSRWALETTQHPIQLSTGGEVMSFPGDKKREYEADIDISFQSRAKVKKAQNYTSIPHMSL
jgi:hypothetical protein